MSISKLVGVGSSVVGTFVNGDFGVGNAGVAVPQDPLTMFAHGEPGLWFDPSDFSSMYQDIAGTNPVTAAGQSVGRIVDKSGNGYYAAPTLDARRPTLAQDAEGYYYLQFDGTDDTMIVTSLNLSSTTYLTLWVGLYKDNETAQRTLLELTPTFASNPGGFNIWAPVTNGGNTIRFQVSSDTLNTSGEALAVMPQTKCNACFTCRLSGPTQTTRLPYILQNNLYGRGTYVNASAGGGNFANSNLYIGSRNNASLRYIGRLYGLIIRGASTNVEEAAGIAAYMQTKIGASSV